MAKDLIVFLGAGGANDAPRVLMEDYCNAAIEAEFPALVIDGAEPTELEHLANLMRAGKVRHVVTWLGGGQDLRFQVESTKEYVNAFEATGTALVKIQGDIPAYFRERHRDVPRNSASLYQADEFLTYRRRFMPEATNAAAMLPPMPMMPKPRQDIDLAGRAAGKLIFQKNGNSANDLMTLWREQLPPATARLVLELADVIREPGLSCKRLDIGDYVFDFLQSQRGIDAPSTDSIAFFTAQIDDYLRRVKSTMIAEALLDFPILVQGEFWDHVDFHGKSAIHIPGASAAKNSTEVEERLGVIDMSPNVDTWPHDRVQRAAGAYSLVLTNEQAWIARDFPDFRDLTFPFEPEAIRERVAAVLSKPMEYLQRAVDFAEAFRAKHARLDFAQSLARIGDLASLGSNLRPPQLQPFFVWS